MLNRALDHEARADGIRTISLSPGTAAPGMQAAIRGSGIDPVSQPNGRRGRSCGSAVRAGTSFLALRFRSGTKRSAAVSAPFPYRGFRY